MTQHALDQFPYIKNKLHELDTITQPNDNSTTQAATKELSEPVLGAESDDHTLSTHNNHSIQALIQLAEKAAKLVITAEKTGNPSDIEQAKQVIYKIPLSDWQEEFLFSLSLTEKSLVLPDLITKLEQLLTDTARPSRAELTATYRHAQELLSNYPSGEQKEILTNELRELGQKMALLQQDAGTEELINSVEQLSLNLINIEDNTTFINELYTLKQDFIKAQNQVKTCIDPSQRKEWQTRLAKVKQEQTNAHQRLLDILNENAEQVNLHSIFTLLDIEVYERLADKDGLRKAFLATYNGHQFASLKECRNAIQKLAGFIMVQTAKTKEQLDEGLIYIEHIPYINLGRDNRAIVAEKLLQLERQNYTSIESLLADVEPYIADVQRHLALINNATTTTEMAQALETVLPQQFNRLDNAKKEIVADQYYLCKEKRPYRSLKKLATDFAGAMEKRLVQSGILEKISVAEKKSPITDSYTLANGSNVNNSSLGLRVL